MARSAASRYRKGSWALEAPDRSPELLFFLVYCHGRGSSSFSGLGRAVGR